MCKNMCNHMFDKRTLLSVFSPVPCRFGGMFLQRPNRTALRTGTFFDSLFLLVEIVRTCPYWSSTLTEAFSYPCIPNRQDHALSPGQLDYLNVGADFLERSGLAQQPCSMQTGKSHILRQLHFELLLSWRTSGLYQLLSEGFRLC